MDINGDVLCGKLAKDCYASRAASAYLTNHVFSVSQFTLLARTKKGTKPDFHGAANPEEAGRLYQYFVERVRGNYEVDRVKDGKFQAMMQVALVNDGPVSSSHQLRSKFSHGNHMLLGLSELS